MDPGIVNFVMAELGYGACVRSNIKVENFRHQQVGDIAISIYLDIYTNISNYLHTRWVVSATPWTWRQDTRRSAAQLPWSPATPR